MTSLPASREELGAAHALLREGFLIAAISRAYYAVFYAAQDAVERGGGDPGSHSGLVREFGRLVVREGGFDPATAAIFRRSFDQRNRADYRRAGASREDVAQSIEQAEAFVDAVEVWLRGR